MSVYVKKIDNTMLAAEGVKFYSCQTPNYLTVFAMSFKTFCILFTALI